MSATSTLGPLGRARWVAPPGEAGAIAARAARDGSLLARFRLCFEATHGARLRIAISANDRYKLWVNGRRAGTGPCRGDAWRHFHDVRDLSPHLVPGANVIGVEVLYQAPRLYRDGAKTGLVGEAANTWGPLLVVHGAVVPRTAEDGTAVTGTGGGAAGVDLGTGAAPWTAALDEAVCWEPGDIGVFAPVGAFERVDLARTPRDWTCAGPCGPDWAPVVARWEAEGAGWGEICPLPPAERPIPLLEETTHRFARVVRREGGCGDGSEDVPGDGRGEVTVPARSRCTLDLDAGWLTTAWPVVPVEGGRGARVALRYAECYATRDDRGLRKGTRDDPRAGDLHGFEDRFVAPGAAARYEPFRWRAFRFLRIAVETGDEPLAIGRPAFVETGYPLGTVTEVASSIPWVERVMEVSLRTLRRCMHETYEDCPYHEQVQYLLDARLEALYTYAACADTRLARKALEDFHASLAPEGLVQSRAPASEPNFIPAFALHWVMMVEEYWRHAGDLAPARRYRPTIDAVLDWFDRHVGPLDLVERLGHWEFVDWAEEWTNARGDLTGIPAASGAGPVTTTNLLYVSALESAARMADATGRPGVAGEYRARAATVRGAVQGRCWSASRGLYREGPRVEEYTQHAQSWAVLAGLADGEAARSILAAALDDPGVIRCTFPARFFLFRALEAVGMYDRGWPLWEAWLRELDRGLTTWPEDGSRQRSDCHGWSALPLHELARCVLGVRSAGVGWAGIEVRPHPGPLPDARGRVVTPRGVVEVAWTNRGRFALHVSAPAGVPTRVVLPDGGVRELPLGGTADCR